MKKSKVDYIDNQLKGNWGEQFVAAQLTACGCYVRHVVQGHDSGIDLYCESIVDGRPFLHFFVQVKTKKEFNVKSKTAKYYAKRKHVRYWKGQPVPVFLFLVPDQRGEAPAYFIASARRFKGATVVADVKIQSKSDLQKKFFGKQEFWRGQKFKGLLNEETFAWSLMNGVLSPLPDPETSAMRSYDVGVMKDKRNRDLAYMTLHGTQWRICEDQLNEIINFRTLSFRPGKTIGHLKKLRREMVILEEMIQISILRRRHVSRVTLALWYAAQGNNLKAWELMVQAERLVRQKLTTERDLAVQKKCKEHRQNIRGYKALLKSRMKKED